MREATENLGATNSEENPQLYAMLSEMNDDFQTRWGAETTYSSRTIRADRCRIHGVPKLAFWASMLDPHTKNSTTKIMSGADRRKLWDDEDAIAPEDAIHDEIRKQLECFKDNAKMPFLTTTDEYNCPLKWWSENWTKYPDVWDLAQQILHIPATSASAERVFSSASNIINKKRVRLSPENANLLIFLKDNQDFAEWDK